MSLAIAFSEKTDLSGLRLEQTDNGHVVTPWFTMDQDKVVWYSGQQYQAMKAASSEAFCKLLEIQPSDVTITEYIDHDGARWWRLGTRYPEELPKPKKPKLPPVKLAEGHPAIDI